MRKLILQMQLSLDGFACGPNGELQWIFPGFDAECTAWEVDRLWEAGAHLMGSVTYGDMAAHWPTSTEPYAPPMNEIPKVVFSKSLRETSWGDTRIAPGELAVEIDSLKRQPGKDLLAHGGVRFARSLIDSGLVDEYRLMVHPVVLGKGLSPFSTLPAPARLKLVDAITFQTGVIAKSLHPA